MITKEVIYVIYNISNRTFSDAIHLFVAIQNQQCNMKWNNVVPKYGNIMTQESFSVKHEDSFDTDTISVMC